MVLALVAAVLVAVPPAVAEAGSGRTSADAPLRILIVGDSVSQGSAGDWTWRYRLWQHLTATGTAVDFVGPRDDLWDNIAGAPASQDYVEPDFDRDHAARWGATLAFFPSTDHPVDELVDTYAPDVVLEMLGINDLAFLRHDPARVADDMRAFVATARKADPDVDVVLGHLSQTWFPGANEFNALLDELALDLDDPTARVTTAAVDVGYMLRDDTWDESHPDARGEVRIAAAMADALAGLELAAPYPRPLAAVPRGPRVAPVLTGQAGDGSASLSWTGPPGADHEIVWLRDLTRRGDWASVGDPVGGTAFALDGLSNGHTYALRLQPVKGYWAAESDIRLNVVRVRPLPPLPGRVEVPRLRSPRQDRVRVIATTDPHATSYRLDVAPTRSCDAGSVRFTGRMKLTRPRATFSTSASFVRVRMVARNLAGSGPYSAVSRCLRVR